MKCSGLRTISPVAARRVTGSGFGRLRAVNGRHLAALVRAGATLVYGKLVKRPDDY